MFLVCFQIVMFALSYLRSRVFSDTSRNAWNVGWACGAWFLGSRILNSGLHGQYHVFFVRQSSLSRTVVVAIGFSGLLLRNLNCVTLASKPYYLLYTRIVEI